MGSLSLMAAVPSSNGRVCGHPSFLKNVQCQKPRAFLPVGPKMDGLDFGFHAGLNLLDLIKVKILLPFNTFFSPLHLWNQRGCR